MERINQLKRNEKDLQKLTARDSPQKLYFRKKRILDNGASTHSFKLMFNKNLSFSLLNITSSNLYYKNWFKKLLSHSIEMICDSCSKNLVSTGICGIQLARKIHQKIWLFTYSVISWASKISKKNYEMEIFLSQMKESL